MTDRFRVSNFLAQRLERHQVPLPKLLRRAGLPEGFFRQEKICVSTAELFALWRAIEETSEDPAIALKMGAEPRLERYDATAIAAVCSQSLRDALQRLARYKRLTCPEEIRVHITRDEAAVEFIFLQAEEVEPTALIDSCLSWVFAIGQRGTDGQIKPVRLDLVRSEKHRELLENHFNCRVRFKAGRNALIFRSGDLDRPFVTHNAELLTAIGAQLEAELQARNVGSNLDEEIKRTLKRSLAGKRPTLQHIARELGLGPRTLQRRLTDEGFTFQQLVEDTRRELAYHYLKHSTVELNEAAFLLGYEDSKSFFRAFQLWEGTSPGEWRTMNQIAS